MSSLLHKSSVGGAYRYRSDRPVFCSLGTILFLNGQFSVETDRMRNGYKLSRCGHSLKPNHTHYLGTFGKTGVAFDRVKTINTQSFHPFAHALINFYEHSIDRSWGQNLVASGESARTIFFIAVFIDITNPNGLNSVHDFM